MDVSEIGSAFLPVHEGADLDLELDVELLGSNGINAFRLAFEKAYRRLFPGECLEILSMKRMPKYGRDMMIIELRKKQEQ